MNPIIKSIADNLDQYFTEILPVSEIKKYLSTHQIEVIQFIAGFDVAVTEFKRYRHDPTFAHRKLFQNSYELSNIYQHDLPNFSDFAPSPSVYKELSTDPYFSEVWQIKSLENLVINLILLVYRTSILHQHRSKLYSKTGQRLVQISCAIEEMVFSLYSTGQTLSIYPALSMCLTDWQSEGFTQGLHDLVIK